MNYEQWWGNKKQDVEGASMALLEKLFENAWWTGQNHTRKEKDYAFNKKGDRRRSFAVESIASLDQHFVLASGGSRPGRDDNQPGRRPLGGASFGGRGK